MADEKPVTTQASDAPPASTETAQNTSDASPVTLLLGKLDDLIRQADYDEVYGLSLKDGTESHKLLIVQKFLRANANDLVKAEAQLLETLKWRKTFQPLKAKEETFSKQKFGRLGYVTSLNDVPESASNPTPTTFNIYGAVTDPKGTFGDLDAFLRWRVGLMELTVEQLHLEEGTKTIPDYGQGPDPHQAIQIHDYLNVSFLRQDPDSKAAAKLTIETLQKYYPETLSRKFFVNVPRIMGWMFGVMKMMMSKETARKLTVITWGKDLAAELGQGVPKEYGGTGPDLDASSKTLKLEDI